MSKEKKYAVIDVETTGGYADKGKIIEIAIVISDGVEILEQYETLINPECRIPAQITNLTSITNEMVAEAPKFFEVARKIVELTEGCIFVAHNARYDYSFIRTEFQRLGYTYVRKQLCTVRLTRKVFPKLGRYNLSSLIKHFNLPLIGQPHRAMADTFATAKLLELNLLQLHSKEKADEEINLGIQAAKLPANITLEMLHELPEACGVYYFLDKAGDIIYVGKSINIKKRVMQHFGDYSKKGDRVQRDIYDIDFEVTGSELVALLKESQEIKAYRPKINQAQRRRTFPYVIYQFANEQGFLELDIARNSKAINKQFVVLSEFPTLLSAKGALNTAIANLRLCTKLCNLDKTDSFCFNYHIKKCDGACGGLEQADTYNRKVLQAVQAINTYFGEEMIIVDQGRTATEKAVVIVQGGVCRGYGFVEDGMLNGSLYEILAAIPEHPAYPETTKIIKRQIAKDNSLKIIKLGKQLQAFL